MDHYDVLIVGAGQAGAQAAITLRQEGLDRSVAIVGEEPELPYERPPLSKAYLSGEKLFERMLIRPSDFWIQRGIDFLLNRRIKSVDPKAHTVSDADGGKISYGQLIWAAGGRPRRLTCSGSNLAGVHTVRNRADVEQLKSELPKISSVVVVGGGYIGLEAASVLRKLGKQIVLVEALDRVLARVAGEDLSRFFEAEHRAQGVDVKLGTSVECIEGDRRISGVRLSSGETITCQAAIIGVGIVPEVAPLLAAGAEGNNGVAVDAQCRTSLPEIFAIGDCALHRNAFAGNSEVRLESVQNANDQANVCARTIAGRDVRYDSVPWFWSDQYDLKLQTVGLSTGYDDAVVRGNPEARSFSVAYFRRGQIIALDAVNVTRDYVQARKLIAATACPDRGKVADPAVALKDLLPPVE